MNNVTVISRCNVLIFGTFGFLDNSNFPPVHLLAVLHLPLEQFQNNDLHGLMTV